MLKIDLLPQHFIIARRNKKSLTVIVPLLIVVALAWLGVYLNLTNTITKTKAELDDATIKAQAVINIENETKDKEGKLAPIKEKIDFVETADRSGEAYWDRFHEVNKYIYDRAVMSEFKIAPPASCSFKVELSSTEDAGRFILDLIRCPFISGISISGASPMPGGTIAATPTGGGAGGAAPGGAPGGAPGAGAPGAPGPGGPVATPTTGGAEAAIVFNVACTLTTPISVPAPPGGAAAAGAAGPGAPGPGAAPPTPAPAPDAGGDEEKGGKKGKKDEGGGGGGLKARNRDSGGGGEE